MTPEYSLVPLAKHDAHVGEAAILIELEVVEFDGIESLTEKIYRLYAPLQMVCIVQAGV